MSELVKGIGDDDQGMGNGEREAIAERGLLKERHLWEQVIGKGGNRSGDLFKEKRRESG